MSYIQALVQEVKVNVQVFMTVVAFIIVKFERITQFMDHTNFKSFIYGDCNDRIYPIGRIGYIFYNCALHIYSNTCFRTLRDDDRLRIETEVASEYMYFRRAVILCCYSTGEWSLG